MRLLYQMELSGKDLDSLLAEASQILPQDEARECFHACEKRGECEQHHFLELFSGEPTGYTLDIVRGVIAHQGMIDAFIDEASQHWALHRMPPVDRAITRVATWEVCYNDGVPDSVAINEAITLAKEFGGDDSSKFVNGVLGKIAELNEGTKRGKE